MNNLPLVSVLMTAYNREKYIAEAIESVLASTYTNFELIIVDDCSSDRTVEIAKSFEAKDSRVRVYVNEKNLGDYPNRNRAASYAKGEYLKYVDSDDKLYPDGIQDCVSAMLSFPESGFGLFYKGRDENITQLSSQAAIHTHFFEKPFLVIGPGGTIIKREFFENIGKFPEKYGSANDMYFNLKAASKTSIVLLPFDFLFYRLHEGQQLNNQYGYLYNNYRYQHDALKEIDMPLNEKQKDWIGLKNKRRFAVNITNYFFKTCDFPKTIGAIRLANYTLKDFFQGVFH